MFRATASLRHRGDLLNGRDVMRVASGAVVGVAIALALVGCRQGSGLSDGLLQVENLSRSDASVTWDSPGLLGPETHSEPIPACDGIQVPFAERTEITVRTTEEQRTFVVEGRASSRETVLQLVIEEDGTVAEVPADQAPTSPYCVD
jgi:hypothetical protein